MVWQHDKVNRLMDHQTNTGGRKEEKKREEKEEKKACLQTTKDGKPDRLINTDGLC